MGMTMSEKILALEYEPEIFLWQNVILVPAPAGRRLLWC